MRPAVEQPAWLLGDAAFDMLSGTTTVSRAASCQLLRTNRETPTIYSRSNTGLKTVSTITGKTFN